MHSGTTMVVRILMRHSLIYAVSRELRLFENHPGFDHRHNGEKKYLTSIVRSLSLKGADSQYIERYADGMLEQTTTVGELTIRVIELLKQRNGKLVWAEKTPSNVYFVKEILDRFPDARILLIYRDIRSIIASKKLRTLGLEAGRYDEDKIDAKRLEKDWNVIADSFSWRGAVKAQRLAEMKYPDKVLALRYEDFVEKPLCEFRRVCDFLGVPLESECLNIGFRNSALRDADQAKGGIVASQTDWSAVLTRHEVLLANALNAGSLTSLGYSVKDYGNLPQIVISFCKELPGVFGRLLKRYKMFSLSYFYVYCKSMLKRI